MASASHGVSLQFCQKEWRSAHSALPVRAASVAITCTNARAVPARLRGSLTVMVLLAVPAHFYIRSVDVRSDAPIFFDDEQL
jgi:hypothetical protein